MSFPATCSDCYQEVLTYVFGDTENGYKILCVDCLEKRFPPKEE